MNDAADPVGPEVEIGEQEGALDDVYTVLSERHQSGQSDVSERHNEHQP